MTSQINRSTNRISSRLDQMSRDGNLDVEDVEHALSAARADGKVTELEKSELRTALQQHGDKFEPAAKSYLQDSLAGKDAKLTNRVVLAPHPKGARQKDLYYARNDVVALQESLSKLGISTGIDGDYGPGTVKSVKELQRSAGIKETGVVDSVTLGKLNAALEAKGIEALDLTPRARIRPDSVLALKNGANTKDNKEIEAGLNRLGQHFGIDEFKTTADGKFDDDTERAVKALQRRAYLPQTGIVDTATLDALNTSLEAMGLETAKVASKPGDAGFKGKVKLHFYPGDDELKLYVEKDGKVLDSYGMVGGRAEAKEDPNNPHVNYSPTPKGKYKVAEVNPHASGAWPYSYVPYGSHLREKDGEVQFRDGKGDWKWATGPDGVFADRNPPPLDKNAYFRNGKLSKVWTLNDFGHMRGRLQSVSSGRLQGHMIHSSPFTEETRSYFKDTARLLDSQEALDSLGHSHGCEHIHPKDMDELIAKGYLAPGTQFVVHGYDERHSG